MFNGPRLTREVRDLILSRQFDEVEERIYQDINDFPQGEKTRIRQLRMLYNSVKRQLNAPLEATQERVELTPYRKTAVQLEHPPTNLLTLAAGFYATGKTRCVPTAFDEVFGGLSDSLRQALMTSRFNTDPEMGDHDSFGIIENVMLCGQDSAMHAYSFGHDHYLNEESARTAKALSITSRYQASQTIENALLLPIPHVPNNYYHVMAEMVYGLRYAHQVPTDVPIVYQQDHFSILHDIVKRMGIDSGRLLSFEHIKETRIQRALLPGPPPYYWNQPVFSFFSSLKGATGAKSLKIYLSRSFSSRGPHNEKALEHALIEQGYLIAYPEKLTFSQQIELFSLCAELVTPHGAGITNIAFMPKGSRLVELFTAQMLQRDFFMRSRHNDMEYRTMVYDGDIDIEALIRRLRE